VAIAVLEEADPAATSAAEELDEREENARTLNASRVAANACVMVAEIRKVATEGTEESERWHDRCAGEDEVTEGLRAAASVPIRSTALLLRFVSMVRRGRGGTLQGE
jgi:hypothetical protein